MLPSFPTNDWKFYAIAVLVLTNVLTFSMWRDASSDLVKQELKYEQTVSQFKTAQEQANKNAQDIKKKLENEAKQNAKEADARYGALLGEYRANLLRYKANQSVAPRASDNLYRPPIVSDRPSPDSGVLTISLKDAEICAVNTARLVAVQEWAVNLPRD